MKRWEATVVLSGVLVAVAANGAPPGPRDPDWPCQQIKVPSLSLASVWAGPGLDLRKTDWQRDQSVSDLVEAISQRRMPLQQAQDKIRDFAQQSGAQRQERLLALMGGLFNVLDAQRAAVIAGLDRLGARQKQLAANIRSDNEKLQKMLADSAADAGDVNQMTQRIAWEAEVLQDRRQAVSYACDVPAKIEQRLFALARAIQENL